MNTAFLIWLKDKRRAFSKDGKRLSFKTWEEAEKAMQESGIINGEIEPIKISRNTPR